MTTIDTPSTWDRAGLEALGFEGFVPLVKLTPEDVPDGHGIYIVLRPGSEQPLILAENPVRRPRLKLYSIEYLLEHWVENTQVVYIGKAAGSAGLQDRLKPYARKSSGHSGGRAIWQLSDADELLVCWKVLDRAKEAEDMYIAAFKAHHAGMRPFANWNG